jgi:hypothetical protein
MEYNMAGLPFFNDSRKSESTGIGPDTVQELVTRPIETLRTQASKMQAIRPTGVMAIIIEMLKNLKEEVNHIAQGQQNVTSQPSQSIEEEVTPPKPNF